MSGLLGKIAGSPREHFVKRYDIEVQGIDRALNARFVQALARKNVDNLRQVHRANHTVGQNG